MVRTNDDTFCLLHERWAGQPGHQDPAEQASHPHQPAQVRHDQRYCMLAMRRESEEKGGETHNLEKFKQNSLKCVEQSVL